ncbi:MAG TPA: universal stress protein [Nitrospirae bacterium]|nr:stress response protein NhaX [bacterium BMS3Abin10]GBE38876.1 stress response protein NhaX [bacterium BMS3Bbin08]HDK17178.1 universal stress protein [Nitrospirota bacterium]HDK81065.1 universal stress protein [Nitrospirota bacterium]HDO26068.1 universal stress protein [Nitrospirota bacterium]
MKKILIAVDNTKGSQTAVTVFEDLFSCSRPETVVLVYVERFSGTSFLDDMITDAEMKTLKEVLIGTEYQEAVDKKAANITGSFKKTLEDKGVTGIKTVVREGHPAEEILKAAKEENADMIIMGSRGKRAHHSITLGSISREVVNNAEIPVLIAK